MQLQLYTPALEYPPLLIVSDIESIVIHTAFTDTVPEIRVLTIDDVLDATKLWLLRQYHEMQLMDTMHTLHNSHRFDIPIRRYYAARSNPLPIPLATPATARTRKS